MTDIEFIHYLKIYYEIGLVIGGISLIVMVIMMVVKYIRGKK